jgi:hypothetical protein
MKKISIFLFLFLPAINYGQNTYTIIFKITDSVVLKKNYPYATKVNLEINVPGFQETLFLYRFNKCVGSYALSQHTLETVTPYSFSPYFDYLSLQYVVENENYEIIESDSVLINIINKKTPTFRVREHIGTFVNSKQQIIRKELKNYKKRKEYNLAKYEISSTKQNVALYLLLSVYHKDLPKGDYYLYLTYFLSPSWQFVYDINDSTKGRTVSNRVKLIVE